MEKEKMSPKTKSLRPSMRAIQRSKGQSTVEASAYQNRERLHLEPTKFTQERSYNYANRKDVIARGILAPDNAPEYLKGVDGNNREEVRAVSERLWNDAEYAGGKGNAITGRSWIIPLPSQLSREQQTELVRDFAQSYFVSKGMVVQYAIHEPDKRKGNDLRNYHAHLLTTDREITPDGFARTKTESRRWSQLERVREAPAHWEKACNRALEKAGLSAELQIDNRPKAEQYLDAVDRGDFARANELKGTPQVHYGKNGKESELVVERQEIAARQWQERTGEVQLAVNQVLNTDRVIRAVDEQIELAKGDEYGRGRGAEGRTADRDREIEERPLERAAEEQQRSRGPGEIERAGVEIVSPGSSIDEAGRVIAEAQRIAGLESGQSLDQQPGLAKEHGPEHELVSKKPPDRDEQDDLELDESLEL